VRPPLTVRELAGRRNMLLLGLTLVATAVFGGWLWYSTNYLWRVAEGPEPVTLAELTQMGPEGADRWFQVTTDVRPGHLLKTTRRSRRGGTSITNHFALIRDKALIVETSQSELPPSFLAWASEFDEQSDYFKRARGQLDVWTGSARRLPMSPLLLRVSGSVEFTRWLVGLGISAAVLGLLVMYWRISRALLDYTRTPQVARLRKSALAPQGLAAMVGQIDHQLAGLDPSARRTGPILLRSWLVTVNQNTFSLISSSDVLWVAPYVFRRKLFSLIPLGKTHAVLVFSRTGPTVKLSVPEAKLHEVLGAFYRWAPWAVIGSNDDMAARFGSGANSIKRWFSSGPSRKDLIAAVDKRREQMLSASAADATASGSNAAH